LTEDHLRVDLWHSSHLFELDKWRPPFPFALTPSWQLLHLPDVSDEWSNLETLQFFMVWQLSQGAEVGTWFKDFEVVALSPWIWHTEHLLGVP
jgi:hypothetical protein